MEPSPKGERINIFLPESNRKPNGKRERESYLVSENERERESKSRVKHLEKYDKNVKRETETENVE